MERSTFVKLPCKGKVTVCLLCDSNTNLEESAWTLILPDLGPAVHCALNTFCVYLLFMINKQDQHDQPDNQATQIQSIYTTCRQDKALLPCTFSPSPRSSS